MVWRRGGSDGGGRSQSPAPPPPVNSRRPCGGGSDGDGRSQSPAPTPPVRGRADHALNTAAYYGHVAVMIELLREGANLEEVDPNDGWRALHCAVMTESLEAVEYLLKQKADVDAVGPGGLTALHLACRDNSAEVVQVLLAGGADRGALDGNGRTAADLAAAGSGRALAALEGRPAEAPAADMQDMPAEVGAPAPAPAPVGSGAVWFGPAVDPAESEALEEEKMHNRAAHMEATRESRASCRPGRFVADD